MENHKTFREACCEELAISAEAFEERVLWQCLHPRGLRLGKLQWRFNRHYFDTDLELIRTLADCRSLSDMRGELDDHRYHNPVSGLRRSILCLRMSGQRLMDFAAKFIQ